MKMTNGVWSASLTWFLTSAPWARNADNIHLCSEEKMRQKCYIWIISATHIECSFAGSRIGRSEQGLLAHMLLDVYKTQIHSYTTWSLINSSFYFPYIQTLRHSHTNNHKLAMFWSDDSSISPAAVKMLKCNHAFLVFHIKNWLLCH